jgi:hypothetical protein
MDDIYDQHVDVLGTLQFTVLRGRAYGVQRHFKKIFQFIVAVSFIDGGNRSTWRKPPTCRKSLTNFIPC